MKFNEIQETNKSNNRKRSIWREINNFSSPPWSGEYFSKSYIFSNILILSCFRMKRELMGKMHWHTYNCIFVCYFNLQGTRNSHASAFPLPMHLFSILFQYVICCNAFLHWQSRGNFYIAVFFAFPFLFCSILNAFFNGLFFPLHMMHVWKYTSNAEVRVCIRDLISFLLTIIFPVPFCL